MDRLMTPWDGIDTSLVLTRQRAPTLVLPNKPHTCIGLLPLGAAGDKRFWQNEWNACESATDCRRSIARVLQNVSQNAERIPSIVFRTRAMLTTLRKANSKSDLCATPTVQSKKRARDSDSEVSVTTPPPKRMRVTESRSPMSNKPQSQRRPSTPLHPPTPPGTPPSSRGFKLTMQDVLTVQKLQDQLVISLVQLSQTLAQIEAVERQYGHTPLSKPQASMNPHSSISMPMESLSKCRDLALSQIAQIDDLAGDLIGFLNIQNSRLFTYLEDLADENVSRDDWNIRENEHFWDVTEKGVLGYWIHSMERVLEQEERRLAI